MQSAAHPQRVLESNSIMLIQKGNSPGTKRQQQVKSFLNEQRKHIEITKEQILYNVGLARLNL